MEGCKYTYVIVLAPLLTPFDQAIEWWTAIKRRISFRHEEGVRPGTHDPPPGKEILRRTARSPQLPDRSPNKRVTPIRLHRLRPIRVGMACRY